MGAFLGAQICEGARAKGKATQLDRVVDGDDRQRYYKEKGLISMNKILLISLCLAILLTACGSPMIPPAMMTAMDQYATWYEAEYPAETINTARVCAAAPSGMMYSEEIDTYIVTCKMSTPKGYGIVFIVAGTTVSSTCGVDANSQRDLENIFHGLGYK
jgi:hypothetical protein